MFNLEQSFPKGRPVQARMVRDLVPADFSARAVDTTPLETENRVKGFKHRHHALARALAAGITPFEAATMCSYAVGTVRNLMQDPAFNQLITFYAENARAQAADLSVRMSQIALEAADEILRRAENNPEEVSLSMLQDLVTKFADRTGHAPAATSVHQHLHLNVADRLDSARKRLATHRTIDVTKEIAA